VVHLSAKTKRGGRISRAISSSDTANYLEGKSIEIIRRIVLRVLMMLAALVLMEMCVIWLSLLIRKLLLLLILLLMILLLLLLLLALMMIMMLLLLLLLLLLLMMMMVVPTVIVSIHVTRGVTLRRLGRDVTQKTKWHTHRRRTYQSLTRARQRRRNPRCLSILER